MIDDSTSERLKRLRMARDRIEAKLADPRTPAYSVAPLTNQLRLTDKEIDRIERPLREDDEGLPTTPDQATFVDFMRYRRRQWSPRPPARRSAPNAWARRYDEILDAWEASGFVGTPSPRWSEQRYASQQEWRQEVDEWLANERTELSRCLEARPPTTSRIEVRAPGCAAPVDPRETEHPTPRPGVAQ